MTNIPPLFVAEVSANHLGSFDRALSIIEAAASAGAGAVKFQTYTAETMTLDIEELSVSAGHTLWGGRKLFELYQEAFTPWEWHKQLFEHAQKLGLTAFSTPFDLTAVDFLESLDVPMYKIASLETSDHILIRRVAETGKPLIVSTGATNIDEIDELVEVVRKTGNKDLTLLVCTSSYPADPVDSHLRRMETLRSRYGLNVGLSDHTLGIGVSIAAITLGASIIEKHITLRRSDGGADSAFSMEPEEFRQLVTESSNAIKSLGNSEWKIQESENESRRLRRSLIVVKPVKEGDPITIDNVKSIRPAIGMSPKYLDQILGMNFKSSLQPGEGLLPRHIKDFNLS